LEEKINRIANKNFVLEAQVFKLLETKGSESILKEKNFLRKSNRVG
jgi:hypothetical protein